MAKLYFRFATMESGKSAEIIQIDYNYNKVGIKGILLIPEIDKTSDGRVLSRLGNISIPAIKFKQNENLFDKVKEIVKTTTDEISYVILDEANFITQKQAEQLSDIVDFLDIDVLAYGLLSNFKTYMFEGTKRLIELQDDISELSVKSLCHCGKKANFNSRIVNNELVKDGEEILLDTKDGKMTEVKYIPLCRKCYKLNKWEK